MHESALKNAKWFFEKYVDKVNPCKILEIGSRGGDLLRKCKPDNAEYIGLDLQEDANVDVVSNDPEKMPFENDTFDYVVSSSCFEHDEFFWITYLEIMRVLKPGGMFYLNAPSNGPYHDNPVDCWRFYGDCGYSLAKWGKRNGYENNEVVEKFIDEKLNDVWEDYVCVFKK
jgi:SAM-dependent methyltransferase